MNIAKTAAPGVGANLGMRTFITIWLGQLISLIGSQLTGFAMSVWVYDQTHSVSMLAISQVAIQAPYVLFTPLAGVLADRLNRRTTMIISDLGAGLAVAVAASLYLTHNLQPWMVFLINFFMATFHSLMWPSYTAAVTVLVPKEQYGRANGFMQLGEAIPQIAGPALAGMLYVSIQLGNMALIDFVTYLFSVGVLLMFIRIPNPPQTADGQNAKGSVWKEMRYGWDYIIARKGLLALLTFFLVINFIVGVMQPLLAPLILDNWQANTFGLLNTIWGVGVLAGTLVMSAWGGGKRKVYPLLGSSLIAAFFLIALSLRTSIPYFAVSGLGFMFFIPFINASSQAIWQAKVAPDVQGRVFGVRRTIALSSSMVAPLFAAPLADYIFKPGMSEGGSLAQIFGPLIGVGPTHGVALLISILGFFLVVATVVAMLNKDIRNVEIDLPDHVDVEAEVIQDLAPEQAKLTAANSLNEEEKVYSNSDYQSVERMNTDNTTEKQPVEVILVKEAACQKWLKPAVDRVRELLYELSAETSVPILVKNITAQDAISGALPDNLVAQGWEVFYRMQVKMFPAIIMMGRLVALGQQPDRETIKQAMLDANQLIGINNVVQK